MENKIQHFRQIVFWPLEITSLSKRDKPATINAFLKVIQPNWEVADNSTKLGDDDEGRREYAERVFFHPFVQRFLYEKTKSETSPLHIFTRKDISHLRFYLNRDPRPIKLYVERLELFLFQHGLAILTMEIRSAYPLPLDEVEEILDRFRRVYPPYWYKHYNEIVAGHCPSRVEWMGASLNGDTKSDYEIDSAFRKFVTKNNTTRPANHWQHLLEPMKPWESDCDDFNSFYYRQIEDERLPFMAYLSLNDPTQLSRGDFVRICFADEPGPSKRLPYAYGFLEHFERDYCYDRFWDTEMRYAKDDPWAVPAENWLTTRYLCCGYGFVMVGKHDSNTKHPFFTDEYGGALAHFRRHYFKMGLIAHYHRAALLSFSDALSQAVEKYNSKQPKLFHDEVKIILDRFLSFTHRYWFQEVSNQVQPRELFALWTKHLETQSLFEQVKQEAQDANSFLDMQFQQDQAKVGLSLSETAVRLTVVATVGLAVSLVGTYLAIPWDAISKLDINGDAFAKEWWVILMTVFFVWLGTVSTIFYSDSIAKSLKRISECGKSDKNDQQT